MAGLDVLLGGCMVGPRPSPLGMALISCAGLHRRSKPIEVPAVREQEIGDASGLESGGSIGSNTRCRACSDRNNSVKGDARQNAPSAGP